MEAEGVKWLRSGMLLEFAAALLAFLGMVLMFTIIGLLLGVIVIIVAVVFAIIALVRLYRGFSMLEGSVKNAGLGKVGVILAIIPLVNIVGYILVGIALYSIGKAYGSPALEVGGILTAIPMVSFIGLVVSYFGLGSVRIPPPQQPSQQGAQ